MAHPPRVFTIPAAAPFLPTLISALVKGRLVAGFAPTREPLALPGATIYLPTRRACRLARDAFLDVLGTQGALLPRIVAVGDVDEDEIVFAQAAGGDLAGEMLELPQALGALERRLLLARLILAWASRLDPPRAGETPLVANRPASALSLADDLARLIDDMTTRGVSWDRLDDLVPDHLDAYWQLTLDFLKIARERWPEILAERGLTEAAVRRDALIKAEAARLRHSEGPVIVAGSTGSIPATAELIAAVAGLPHGAVVLPGLDTDLDEDSWRLIAGRQDGDIRTAPVALHPQFALKALLARIGIDRGAVESLGACQSSAASAKVGGRARLVSEVFRPADATELWRTRTREPAFLTHAEHALEGLTLIEAANAEEEALAIAIALREAITEPHKSAALVTPDRALARRVLAALGRWNVAVDDSGGDSLADTSAGLFARLAAQAAIGALAPVDLLALLKHPLLRLGARDGAHAQATAALERAVLRGPRPRSGCTGLGHALETFRSELGKLHRKEKSELHPSDPRTDLKDHELAAAADLVARLGTALAPLTDVEPQAACLAEIARRHRMIVAALSSDQAGTAAAFAGADGSTLAQAFDALESSAPAADLAVPLADYADLFQAAIADRVVRRPERPGVRVRILGLLEARLTSADRRVLGGLNEGTWPPETRGDAWLNRPMRLALGLDVPERRIGLSAHDFAQMLGAPEVILTRAGKVAGAPTNVSRFVQRLAAVAGEGFEGVRERGEKYLAWARALDRPDGPPRPTARPAPKPPAAVRPTRLTVTEIEHWLRDPYTIYAKHILRLLPLEPVDLPPGAADRGTVIHKAIGDFTQAFAAHLPDDAVGELLALGRRHFAALDDVPEARAFWWPRFVRIASWFANWERERRAEIKTVHAEIRGEIEIPLGGRSLRLSARADRIERRAGGYAILDYKTGQLPTRKQVASGLSPQLTLEGAILRAGKFSDVPAGSIQELVYVALKGGDPIGEERSIDFPGSSPDAESEKALRKLTEIARRFEDPETPYLSRERVMWRRRAYGDYDHLARVKEWSPTAGAADEEAPS
jgi:ATP-dependent helicase/nuclease subunit B